MPNKRTFLYLEQLVLRAGADAKCINIKDIHEGLDFFFANRAHAVKFIDFLQGCVPARFRADKQLVSHDIHTSTYNYKYTFSVEIAPICKVSACMYAKQACMPDHTHTDTHTHVCLSACLLVCLSAGTLCLTISTSAAL